MERMQTYLDAENVLGKRSSRKLANHTYLLRISTREIVVRYHDTNIIVYRSDAPTILSSGGWRTYTTKDRLNRFSPCHIYSENGIWYIHVGDFTGGVRYLFDDCIEVNSDGVPTDIQPDLGEELKQKRKFDRLVTKYIKGYCEYWKGKEMTSDNTAGDCILCRISGYMSGHILDHMREKYYVGHLAVRAVENRGNPGFVLMLLNSELRKGDIRYLKYHLQSYFKKYKYRLFEEFKSNGYTLEVEDE